MIADAHLGMHISRNDGLLSYCKFSIAFESTINDSRAKAVFARLVPEKVQIQFYEKPYLRLSKPGVKPLGKGETEVTIGIERYVVFDLPVAEKEWEKLQVLIKDNLAILIDYWAVDWGYDGYIFKS